MSTKFSEAIGRRKAVTRIKKAVGQSPHATGNNPPQRSASAQAPPYRTRLRTESDNLFAVRGFLKTLVTAAKLENVPAVEGAAVAALKELDAGNVFCAFRLALDATGLLASAATRLWPAYAAILNQRKGHTAYRQRRHDAKRRPQRFTMRCGVRT